MPLGDAVSSALSASPSFSSPATARARKAWESERLWWERWPPRRRGPTPVCKGRQLFSQAALGGSRGDGDRCGSPSRSGSEKAGFGVCSQAGSHPRPPNQIPGRGRAGAGSGGGSGRRHCNFTRPLGLGFLGRVHELWGFEAVPGKLRWPQRAAKTPSPSKTHSERSIHIQTENPPSDPTG